MVNFTTWFGSVNQTISQVLSPEQLHEANLTRIASVLPPSGDALVPVREEEEKVKVSDLTPEPILIYKNFTTNYCFKLGCDKK